MTSSDHMDDLMPESGSPSGGLSGAIHVGQTLRRLNHAIIDRWVADIRSDSDRARVTKLRSLKDELPGFIRVLADVVTDAQDGQAERSGDDNRPSDRLTMRMKVLAVEHGSLRFQTGWTLPELVQDYQSLRRVVLRILPEGVGRDLKTDEVELINDVIDDAISSAVVAYAEYEKTAAEVANRRLVEFLSMLGHEIRNPLAAVSMAYELLRHRGDPESFDQATSVIGNNVSLMSRLLDDMLSMSRITTGKIEFRRERVDLRDVVRRAVETNRSGFQEKGLELRASYPQRSMELIGDPSRLEQVFGNLLSNAIRYTEPGGQIDLEMTDRPTLLVGATNERQIVTTITDTGVGIAEEDIPKLFNLFEQAGDLNRDGLGIGLALVQSLVESHNGRVSVYSRGVGMGSEFQVILPAVDEVDADQGERDTGPDDRIDTIGRSRFLVVDDRASLARMTAALLRECGHEVREAYSGQEAIRLASETPPDVILLDIAMPQMDGFQTLAALRNITDLDQTLIVATSGLADVGLGRKETEDHAFDAFLQKPVQLRKLINTLASLRKPEST